MQSVVPLACFLSMIRPPGVQYENALLQIAPVDKSKCPFVKDSNDIGFQLFTRHNPTVYQELMLNDDERLFASNMDFHAPTVIYFHAFMEQPDDGSGIMVREAYMQRGDTNVIMIDAHHLEAGPWYFTAAQNTWYIGRFAAQFIDYMVSRGLNLNNTHLVGHSLGAQAAGVAGSALKSGRVARITGLDPALPLFSGLPLEQRLDTSDADFVDVIHTDAGIFGYKEAIGHVDFYPNSGKSPQPGCELEVVIPQHLLLNKCDGNEQTRGFYTYYLQSNEDFQNIWREHSRKNQMEPVETGLTQLRARKYLPTMKKGIIFKDKVISNEESQNSAVNNNNLRKKRVKREISTIDVDSKEKTKKHEEYLMKDEQLNLNLNSKQTEVNHGPTGIGEDNQSKLNLSNKLIEVKNETTKTGKDDQRKLNLTNEQIDVKNETTNAIDDTKLLNSNSNEQKLFKNKTKEASTPKSLHKKDKNTKKRQKRFLQFFRSENDDNFIFRALNFLVRNRKNVVPIISVVRDINTLVKSANGELNHVTKERNNYVGIAPPEIAPISYTLELGNESRMMAFVKRLFGMNPKGDRLTIGSGSG